MEAGTSLEEGIFHAASKSAATGFEILREMDGGSARVGRDGGEEGGMGQQDGTMGMGHDD